MRTKRKESDLYSMRSVDRVACILNYLGETGEGSISEIAEATHLARPTVLRLAEALARHGLLTRRASGYSLGPRLVYLGVRNSGISDLRTAALPIMRRLANETGETVSLSTLVGSVRMYIAQVESTQPVRQVIELDVPQPMHAGSSAKALLAWLPESRVQELLGKGPLEQVTERTITDREKLFAELRVTRRQGYATSFGERVREGTGVAAPILTATDQVLGALTIMAPIYRTPEAKLHEWAPIVQRAARDIAVACGALSPASPAPRPPQPRARVRRAPGARARSVA